MFAHKRAGTPDEEQWHCAANLNELQKPGSLVWVAWGQANKGVKQHREKRHVNRAACRSITIKILSEHEFDGPAGQHRTVRL